MRLIDADELKKCAIPCEIHNGALTDLCVPLYQIDNAPTVDLWEMRQEATENALKKAEVMLKDKYDEGYSQGYVDGSTGADWKGEQE